jgi:uncharacterized protein
MTRERLQSLPLDELRRFAEKQSIEFDTTIDKDTLVNLLVDLFEEMAEERDEQSSHEVRVEAKKFAASADEQIDTGQESSYASLPESYNETRLVAMPRDPAWAFAYWEITQDKLVQLRKDRDVRLFLRVYDLGEKSNGRGSRSSFDIPVKLTDSRWYLNLPRPGGRFVLALVYKKRGKEHELARSSVIDAPAEGLSERLDPEWSSPNGETLLAMSLHRSVGQIPGSGTIPQRILSVG